jgi:hypothetical protein
VQPERLAVAADQSYPLVRRDAAERRRTATREPQTGVARQVASSVVVDDPIPEQGIHVRRRHVEVGHAGPPRRHHVESVVLVGLEPDSCGLHPQRHVLAHQHHLSPALELALGGEVQRAGQDAAVVRVGAESRREHLRVRVVQLDVQGAARRADRHRGIQTAVLDAQFVERAQCCAREPAELRVVPLALQFRDDHQRQDDLVLVEPGQRPRVGEQHRGVEHVAAGVVRSGGSTTVGHEGSSLALVAAETRVV